jgi:4-amino-4-deoxy-L-arabinose transferase-like glycosyltransferase
MLVTFALVMAVNLPSVFEPPLAGTEGHRAITGHQMLRDGNWIVPYLFDQPYGRKPPGMYWAIAGVESLLGPHAWVWRMPSVIAAGLTGAIVSLAAGSWFGARSAWVAGVSFLSLVALWSQSRTADIDALNTLWTVAAALALIEASMSRRRVWVPVAGVLIGLMLLTKGPGGITVVVGAAVALILVRRRIDLTRTLLDLAISLLMGATIFGAWVVMSLRTLSAQAVAPDLSGADEGLSLIFSFDPIGRLQSLAVPLLLVIYAIPCSTMMLALLSRDIRSKAMVSMPLRTVVLTFLVACGLGVVAGVSNERYQYTALPLLAVVAAGVWGSLRMDEPARRTRQLLVASVIFWLVFAVPFHVAFVRDRIRRSSFDAAQVLRETVGAGSTVVAGRMILSKPELFWYAGVVVRSPGQRELKLDEVPVGSTAVLFKSEWERFSTDNADQFELIRELTMHPRPAYVVRRTR